jgi:GT2 family glycosyltransferase
MSNSRLVSVVVPSLEGRALLEECLAAVQRQSGVGSEVEIVVVDNGSTDGTPTWLREAQPAVRLLENAFNRGHAAACNRGLAAARGELLVVLNQDVTLDPGWLARVERAFAEDPEAGIVGTKLVYPGRSVVQHGGGWLEKPQGHGRHFGHRERDDGSFDGMREIEWVTGAALALRRATYEALSGFDEGFFPGYFDDVDLCGRARSAGWRVLYVGDACGVHVESALGIAPEVLHGFYERGRLRYTLKHLGPERWLAEFLPVEAQLPYARAAYFDLALDAAEVVASSTVPRAELVPAVVAGCFHLAELSAGGATRAGRTRSLIRELRHRLDQLALRPSHLGDRRHRRAGAASDR